MLLDKIKVDGSVSETPTRRYSLESTVTLSGDENDAVVMACCIMIRENVYNVSIMTGLFQLKTALLRK